MKYVALLTAATLLRSGEATPSATMRFMEHLHGSDAGSPTSSTPDGLYGERRKKTRHQYLPARHLSITNAGLAARRDGPRNREREREMGGIFVENDHPRNEALIWLAARDAFASSPYARSRGGK